MIGPSFSRRLFAQHERVRMHSLTRFNCRHKEISTGLRGLVDASDGRLTLEQIGSSLEGRSINLVRCGEGKIKVLLWSQMHGDESTATLALMDIFNYLATSGARGRWVGQMLRGVSLYVVPMLNPDGAERGQRRTAQSIDMNRDARTLMTPEAKLLRALQRTVKPEFGFNLHDQDLRSVGQTTNVTAIALLAPPLDARRSVNPVRRRAMRVAATIAHALKPIVDGHIATYDDAFEPRAFGDNMQAWGTSTVLIESGHWPDDPGKQFVRRLTFVGILCALRAISDGSYRTTPLSHYTRLVPNGTNIFDIVIRNVTLEHQSGWSHRADIALAIELKNNTKGRDPVVTVKDVGDLSTIGALRTIPGRGTRVPHSAIQLESVVPLGDLLRALRLKPVIRRIR